MGLWSVAGCVISPGVSRWSRSDFPVCYIAGGSYPAPLWVSGGPNEPERWIHLHILVRQKLLASLWEGEGGRLGWAWPHAQSCPGISCTTTQVMDARPASPKAQAGARSGSASCPSLNPCKETGIPPPKKNCNLNSAISWAGAKCHEAWVFPSSHNIFYIADFRTFLLQIHPRT